jgi:hypothetical protein
MKRVILLFLDGVGLGDDDPAYNPLAARAYPTLERLLDRQPIVHSTGHTSTAWAELIPTDAQLGVPGRPQSATGQAALLTGLNAPQRLGEHYGPRPDARVRAIVDEGNVFCRLADQGLRATFCNAYPQGYFDAVDRGKRLLSVLPYAATSAGQALADHDELRAGRALAADFTNEGWRSHLGYTDMPVYSPEQAGALLWDIAAQYSFTLFEHWQTDLLGHRGDLAAAIENFRVFDGFLAGLLDAADLDHTLILITSDHGNVEDCRHGKHTENPAVTIAIGAGRSQVAAQIRALTDITPSVLAYLVGAPD